MCPGAQLLARASLLWPMALGAASQVDRVPLSQWRIGRRSDTRRPANVALSNPTIADVEGNSRRRDARRGHARQAREKRIDVGELLVRDLLFAPSRHDAPRLPNLARELL